MQLDAATTAIIVFVLSSIIGLATVWGSTRQKVKRHDKEIETIHTENREDHRQIFKKLDEINNYIRNGRG